MTPAQQEHSTVSPAAILQVLASTTHFETLVESFKRAYTTMQTLTGTRVDRNLLLRWQQCGDAYPVEVKEQGLADIDGKPVHEIRKEMERLAYETQLEHLKHIGAALGLDIRGTIVALDDPKSVGSLLAELLSQCKWYKAREVILRLEEMHRDTTGDLDSIRNKWVNFYSDVRSHIITLDAKHGANAHIDLADRFEAILDLVLADFEAETCDDCKQETTARCDDSIQQARGNGQCNSPNGEPHQSPESGTSQPE